MVESLPCELGRIPATRLLKRGPAWLFAWSANHWVVHAIAAILRATRLGAIQKCGTGLSNEPPRQNIPAPMIRHALVRMLGLTVGSLRRSSTCLWRLEARLRGAQFDGRVVFNGRPIITLAPGSRLVIGDGVTLNSAPRTNPLGCFQPATVRTWAPGAELILERNVGVSACSVCAALSIRIGEGTILGAGAMVFDNDFHLPEGAWGWGEGSAATARPIVIGRGVFVGTRAMVLKGVTIGDRAVVGAGAVVTKDVPPGAIAVGNPARILLPTPTPR
jgi:acetyltransferase-like isoleucine patch superfamily enzyme